MVKRISILLILILAMVCVYSCSDQADNESLYNDAELAYRAENYCEAQEICDTIVGRVRSGVSIEPSIALKVSLLLVKLGEPINREEENIVSAWECLEYASKNDMTSLKEFIRQLEPEEKAVMMLLRNFDSHKDSISDYSYPEHEQIEESGEDD